jgi:effector-binding domain-containing protein
MKVLRGVLILLLLLAIAYLIWMFFLPSRLFVQQRITVQVPPQEVYEELADFSQWEPWSPWAMRDTSVNYTYLETTTAPEGAYQFQYGDLVGQHAFTASSAPDSLRTSIKFRGLQPGVSLWTVESSDTGTVVQWELQAEYGYLGRVIGVFMGRQVKAFYGDALAALKRHLEGTDLAFPVAETRMPAIQYYALPDTVATGDITETYMAERFLQVYDFLGDDFDTAYYAPMALYQRWGDTARPAFLSVALPSEANRTAKGPIQAGTTVEQPALEVLYRGPYPQRAAAFRALRQYAKQHDLHLKGPLVELYLSNPEEKPAAQQQVTRMLQAYKPDSLLNVTNDIP